VDDKVTIDVNGRSFTNFDSVSIKRSMDALCGSYSISFSPNFSSTGFVPREQDEIKIRIDSETVLTGYVDKFDGGVDTNGTNYTISGRCKTCDIVDCSASCETVQYKNAKVKWVVEQILKSRFSNIEVVNESFLDGYTVQDFSINPGDSAFSVIDRLIRPFGFLLTTTPAGRLTFLTSQRTAVPGFLRLGENIKTISCSYDMTDRFSDYFVTLEPKTDGSKYVNKLPPSKKESVKDGDIKRFRPYDVIGENSMTLAQVKRRAEWERAIRMARSFDCNVTLKGWRNGAGTLWKINTIVTVDAPECDIKQEKLLIKEVSLNQSESGTETTLSLGDVNSYLPEESKQKKKNTDKFANIKRLENY